MRNLIVGGIVVALIFCAGMWVGRVSVQLVVATDAAQMANTGLANTGHNIMVKADADIAQQDDVQRYNDGVRSDTTRTDELLGRVMHHFDSVRDSAQTSEPASNAASGDTCGVEKREVRRLSGQLRTALEQSGHEASRANDNTRLLNQCIRQLYRDRAVQTGYQ